MTQPNYELLKDAYAIIGGIPDEVIDLDRVVKKKTADISCGTIACAAGWLGMHPQFKELGLELVRGWGESYDLSFGKAEYDFYGAMAGVFGITNAQAIHLFGYRRVDEKTNKTLRAMNDKQLWLHRVRKFLKAEGQL